MEACLEKILSASLNGRGEMYQFSRNDEHKYAYLLSRKGLFVSGLGKVIFPSGKFTREAMANGEMMLAEILKLNPGMKNRREILALGIEQNLREVAAQNLFLSLLVDRLNNPDMESCPVKTTAFSAKYMEVDAASLDNFVPVSDSVWMRQQKKNAGMLVVYQSDSVMRLKVFASVIFRPQDSFAYTTAVADVLGALDYSLGLIEASRRPPPVPKKIEGPKL